MSEFNRQHPVAAITRAIDLVRGNLITILVVLVFGASGGGSTTFLWIFAGLFVFLLVAGTLGWWRFVYRVEEGELQIRQGILIRKHLYLTRDRVQVIDVTAGVIQRLFGLVSVEIKTAGSTSREASISAVSKSVADQIVRSLRNNGEQQSEKDLHLSAADEPERLALPGKDLLIAASTSGSFGIALSIIATVFSQIEPLLDESAVYEWFLGVIPSETDAVFIISIVIVFVVFAWLMSFFGTLIKYGDFTLTIRNEELVVRRGIFEKKRITVPFNRIQAIRIVEGVLRQPFGYATIYVESAGHGDNKESGSVVLHPLMKTSEIDAFLKRTLPEYRCDLQSVRPAPRSVTRYIFRSTVVLALILAGVYWLFSTPNWVWLFLVPGLYWGWLRYRDAAVGIDAERIIIRNRLLARTTAIVRRNRAQDITSSSSWIQRFRNLSNLEVAVASGDRGRGFQVRELETGDAEKLLPWLSKGFDPEQTSIARSVSEEHLPGWIR